MNEYLVNDAKRDEIAGFSRTYIALHGVELVGYLTVLTDAIRLSGKERPSGIPYPTAPALKVGRVAVCVQHQRCGVGEILLYHALGMARSFALEAGCRYVTLDAHHDKVEWYEKKGFRRNEGEPVLRRLFRFVTTSVAKEVDLPNVSMRFDILLQHELKPLA